MTLDELKINTTAIITNTQSNLPIRVSELGFTEGNKVRAMFKGISGDPTAYRVKGTTIALRKETSRMINIIITDGEDYAC